MTVSVDEWIKKAVIRFVAEEGDWLCCSLRRVKSVSDGRKSSTPYGFEWLIQTALSYWLLKQSDISNLKIGQQCKNGKKYDLYFEVQQQKLIIEIKTICPGGISYVKSDVIKQFPLDCTPYFLVFSYPNASKDIPPLEGASDIVTGLAPVNFRYYLYKKSEHGAALDGDSAALHTGR